MEWSNFIVQFVRREQKDKAHYLASLARIVGSRSWLGIAPLSFLSVSAAILAVNCNSNGLP
jgi:hypothetical protein